MLGTSHSWAVTMRSILNEMEHEHGLYLDSINGKELVGDKLLQHFRVDKSISFDLDITYTQPANFQKRFQNNSKNKFAIYNYESSVLPPQWKNSHKYVDLILPSSNYVRDIFIKAGWPEEKCYVVPHGVSSDFVNTSTKYSLRTSKSFKFLNVSIPHYRKNIDMVIRAYYELFSEKDDVCLVIKTNLDKKEKLLHFEYDFINMLKGIQAEFLGKRNDLPQLEVVSGRVDNMAELYNACDVFVSATSSEGFGLPLLESLSRDLVVIAPGATGQIDFLNESNSLLVMAKEIPAEARYQYISYSDKATVFMPNFEDLKDKMMYAYLNFKSLKDKFSKNKNIGKYTWKNVSNEIISLCK